MTSILCLIGISGSGKSTWCKENAGPQDVIVNRDSIRKSLFLYTDKTLKDHYSSEGFHNKEKIVTSVQDTIIKASIKLGADRIIIDNTNLRAKYLKEFQKYDLPVSYKLIDCEFKAILNRNSVRAASIPEQVLLRQRDNLNILKKNWDFCANSKIDRRIMKIQQDESLPKCVIFDIDGTLAHRNNRGPYDWSRVSEDTVDRNMSIIHDLFYGRDYKIIICTGRDGSCREATKNWLFHNTIFYDELYIRDEGNNQKDFIIKEKMWREISKKYYIEEIFDDRAQVVEHARKLGLFVFDVANGQF